MTPEDARNWALAAHLSALVAFVGVPPFLGPLVVWLVKRSEDPFVEREAREALNFNLSVLLYAVVGGAAAVVLTIVTFGIGLVVLLPLAAAAGVAWLVLVCVAGYQASRGGRYRYPLTIRFLP
jgi:hypothetical protein